MRHYLQIRQAIRNQRHKVSSQSH